ncbi:MAG TPA: YCF48-related protein [Bacteroidia bacterium]|nr:YCF48-related protein [Bacteroidia bacterium]
MKKIYTVFFASLISIAASAQWSVIYNNTIFPFEELRGCYFMSSDTGIVVGAQTVVGNPATIRRTTDGGTTWTDIYNIYTDTLRAVWFIDDSIGFACGAKGRIIKTLDGGLVWDTVSSGVSYLLRSVHFPTQEIGYICGGGGVILKTADGGFTWNQQVSPLTQDLINIRFLNQDTGYACSSLGTFLTGYVIRTYDGGTTWSIVYSDAQGLLGIAIADANTIVSGGGNQTMVRTTDGGQTWNNVYTGNAGTNMRGSWFTSPTTGWMVGDLGSLFGTTNGGATWTATPVTTQGLLGIHFPNADTGYAVGSGVIIKYVTPCSPAAPASINPGSTVICSFDTVTFCVPPIPNATSYNWILPGGNTILSGQGDTCISAVIGNQTSGNISCNGVNACGPGPLTLLFITVEPVPAPPTITLVGNQLMSDSANNIQWYLNGVPIPGETNQYYTFTQNGSYTVVYTSTSGCSATSVPYDVLDVGINSVSASDGILIYPNPATSHLAIGSWQSAINCIEVFDVFGQNVFRLEPEAGNRKLNIDVSGLLSGIYFVRVKTDNGTISAKFLIRR